MGKDVQKTGDQRDSWVVFDNGRGPETGKIHRLTRHLAVFEIFEGGTTLQMSQVLQGFRALVGQREVYAGRAVVRSMVHTGLATLCEAQLEDDWVGDGSDQAASDPLELVARESFTAVSPSGASVTTIKSYSPVTR